MKYPARIDWTKRVLANSGSVSGCRLVLLILAEHADQSGCSAPSIDRLSTLSRLKPRMVQYALRALVKSGELKVWSKGGGGSKRPTIYQIKTPNWRTWKGNPTDSGVQSPAPLRVQPIAPLNRDAL